MRKLKRILAMIMISSVILTGCGKIDSQDANTKNGSDTSVSSNTSDDNDKKKTDTAEKATEKPITEVKITPKQEYNDGSHIIKFMGLKEYKKFKSDLYKDTPQKGKKYLVLFLECRNDTEEKFYINAGNLSAKLDGKKIEHTVIFNEPEGYTTFFKNYEPMSKDYGFIVWEVPKNWKTLEVTYTGLEYVNQNRIVMSFTRKDMVKPPLYEDVMPR